MSIYTTRLAALLQSLLLLIITGASVKLVLFQQLNVKQWMKQSENKNEAINKEATTSVLMGTRADIMHSLPLSLN